MRRIRKHTSAFTLIELLVVISLIAILVGIGVPTFTSVMNQARKTQAKNEEQQIVAAVNAFYTEYGKYPLVTSDTPITSSSSPSNSDLFFTLRGVSGGANAANAIDRLYLTAYIKRSDQSEVRHQNFEHGQYVVRSLGVAI